MCYEIFDFFFQKEHDDDALEDDAILTEHINKNMITPTNGTPTNGRARSKSGPGHSISSLVSNTHSQSQFSGHKSSRDHKAMLGTLPTSSTAGTGKKQNSQNGGQNDHSQDVNLKVCFPNPEKSSPNLGWFLDHHRFGWN